MNSAAASPICAIRFWTGFMISSHFHLKRNFDSLCKARGAKQILLNQQIQKTSKSLTDEPPRRYPPKAASEENQCRERFDGCWCSVGLAVFSRLRERKVWTPPTRWRATFSSSLSRSIPPIQSAT